MCAAVYRDGGSQEDLATCAEACEALVTPARRQCWSDASSNDLAQYRCGAFRSTEADACFVAEQVWCDGSCCQAGEICEKGACTASPSPGPSCTEACSAVKSCADDVDLAACELACERNLDGSQRTCFAQTPCDQLSATCGSLARPK
jgi:hypothetical protein